MTIGTLNYMKKNDEGNTLFTLNKHVRERVNQWENTVIRGLDLPTNDENL